jgi:hypothetical protein
MGCYLCSDRGGTASGRASYICDSCKAAQSSSSSDPPKGSPFKEDNKTSIGHDIAAANAGKRK